MTSTGTSVELRELAESVFADAWDASTDAFDGDLWRTCEQTGLARLTLPEAVGGSEASLTDAAAVLTAAGQYAARVPLVESDMLAGWLLHTAGLEVLAGPLSATRGAGLHVTGGTATGRLHRVAWARAVAGIAVLVGERVVFVDPDSAQLVEGANVAEEPRDDVVLSDAPVTVGVLPSEAVLEYPLRAALGRSLLLAGAARGALAMAVKYAAERMQFGRPIANFQAVQQNLALAAAEVAAAAAASEAASSEVERHGFAGAAIAVAAAKSRCGEAAGVVARTVHQVHGAIGVTREHGLRMVTSRLWAWRDDDGAEAVWNDRLGARALDAGPDGLWPLLIGSA